LDGRELDEKFFEAQLATLRIAGPRAKADRGRHPGFPSFKIPQVAEEDAAMAALATVGAQVRVTAWDDLQYWARPESAWELQ
jgi:hypothetical protein